MYLRARVFVRVCVCVCERLCECAGRGGLMVGECERVRGTIYLTEILKMHLSEILLMQALRLRKRKKRVGKWQGKREWERFFIIIYSSGIAVILLVVLQI